MYIPLQSSDFGRYRVETSINMGGIDWEARITYDGTPPCKGRRLRGERWPMEPDTSAEVNVCTVQLTHFDNGRKMVALPELVTIDYNELDSSQMNHIEQTCADDYFRVRQEASEREYEEA